MRHTSMMSLPLHPPYLGELMVRPRLVVRVVTPRVAAFGMPQTTSDPVFAISGVQNKDSIGILGGQIGEQLKAFEERAVGVEMLHSSEGIESLVASEQVVAVGKIGKHTLCQATTVPMDAPDAIGAQIMVYGRGSALIKANLKNLHGQSRGRLRAIARQWPRLTGARGCGLHL